MTDWTEVTRKKRKKMVQIFVKVDGSRVTPMEVSPADDKVEDVCEADPKGRGRVCDNAWEIAKKRREAEELQSH